MIHFISEYALFLAKTLTIILGVLLCFAALISIAHKEKRSQGVLVITDINDKFADLREEMQATTLSKPAFKKWLKNNKELEKQREKQKKKNSEEENDHRLFILRFDGDIKASQVMDLREIISALLEISTSKDEVLIILESAGGFVHSYGLAASQLERIKQHKLPLTVAIDKVAASGGYLMACVANKILAAPFAIIGSIGVVAQLPNFHRLLTKHAIDFELHTAGEFKRTLTLFGENTEKGRRKFQEEIEDVHALFKQHIQHFRPQVNIEEVATGEHWHAMQALQYQLIDEIQTSDEFILQKIKTSRVFEVCYEKKQKLSEKITSGIWMGIQKQLMILLAKLHPSILK